MTGMWTEKYRPKEFEDVVGQQDAVKILSAYVVSFQKGETSMPHFLFYGPSGVGKTTCAKIAIKKMFQGQGNWLEINVSDDRGIEIVRNKIKEYAKLAPASGEQFKVIFLDEYDQMTEPAQFAMRRIMEDYASTCRFILSCNYVTKVIDAIRSRCVEVPFNPIPAEFLVTKIQEIVEKEGIEHTKSGVFSLATLIDGDLRRAVNTLHKMSVLGLSIDENNVMTTLGFIPRPYVRKVISIMKNKNEDLQIRMTKLDSLIREVYFKAYPIDKILMTLMEEFTADPEISLNLRIKVVAQIGTIDYRIAVSANPLLQLRSFMCWLLQEVERDRNISNANDISDQG
jgi:replication factor C small subunit